MQVAGIVRQLIAPLTSHGSAPGGEGAAGLGVRETPGNEAVPLGNRREFHEILSQYDVRKITPRELTQLAQELRNAGEIDDATFRDLAAVRLELDRAGAPVDQPVDLIEVLADRLADRQRSLDALTRERPEDAAGAAAARQARDDAARRLQWIQKFALVQAGGSIAVDADV